MTGKLLYWSYKFSAETCSEYVFKESLQFAGRVKHPATEAHYTAGSWKLWKPLRTGVLTLRSAEHRARTVLFCTGVTQSPFGLQLYTGAQASCWLRFRLHSSAPRPFCLFFIRSNSLKQWKLWELAAVCENTIYSTSVFRPLRQYKFLPYGCLLLASPSWDTAHNQEDPWKHWSWKLSLTQKGKVRIEGRKVLSCSDAVGFRLPYVEGSKINL